MGFSSEPRFVELERMGHAALIRFRREEKLNALSIALLRQLERRLDEAEDARCIVFTGGTRTFSAGADVADLRDTGAVGAFLSYRSEGGIFERIASLPQITLSAISGYAIGAGFELALATDFRIADETAVFGLPEVSIGIVPSSGGTQRLTRLVGAGRAKEMILRGRRLSAAEALEWGVVTTVVTDESPTQCALRWSSEFEELPRRALEVAKIAIDRVQDVPLEAGLLIERLAYSMLASTGDAREAADAFLEKRKPTFTGN